MIKNSISLSKRLNNIEKRVEALEKAINKKVFKKNRDDRWEEFVRIVKVQERHQKVNLP